MKQIIIRYWSGGLKNCPYTDAQEFNYSKTKRNKVMSDIVDAGLHILVKDTAESCYIWVDFYSSPFRQR